MEFRNLLAMIFVALIMLAGNWLMNTGTEAGNFIVEEIGRGIFLGPLILIMAIIAVMSVFNNQSAESEIEQLRILHVAWVTSVAIPVGMWLGSSSKLNPEAMSSAVSFFFSVWVTYWGCRLIIRGLTSRNEIEDEDESELGIG